MILSSLTRTFFYQYTGKAKIFLRLFLALHLSVHGGRIPTGQRPIQLSPNFSAKPAVLARDDDVIDTVFFQPFLRSGFDQYAAVSAFLFSLTTQTRSIFPVFSLEMRCGSRLPARIFCQQNRLQIIFALVLSEFQFNRMFCPQQNASVLM